MRKTLVALLVATTAVLLILHGNSPALAQRRGSGSAQRTQPMTAEQFQVAFWDYLTKSRSSYKNWAPFPGRDPGVYEGQSPHGAFLRMYANNAAAGNAKALPNGSIIVKENYGPDKKTLMAVTVMYKTAGYNPAAGDWYWIKYNPNGSVARTPQDKGNMPIAGKFKSCIACHDSAEGNDFAFAND